MQTQKQGRLIRITRLTQAQKNRHISKQGEALLPVSMVIIYVGRKTWCEPTPNIPISWNTQGAATFSCLYHWHVQLGAARGFVPHCYYHDGYT